MTRDITLKTLARNAEPYDPSVAEKGYLLKFVEEDSSLEEQFKKEINSEFLKRVDEVGKCYFVINFRSYKNKRELPKKLRLGYCGRENVPLISLDI